MFMVPLVLVWGMVTLRLQAEIGFSLALWRAAESRGAMCCIVPYCAVVRRDALRRIATFPRVSPNREARAFGCRFVTLRTVPYRIVSYRLPCIWSNGQVQAFGWRAVSSRIVPFRAVSFRAVAFTLHLI